MKSHWFVRQVERSSKHTYYSISRYEGAALVDYDCRTSKSLESIQSRADEINQEQIDNWVKGKGLRNGQSR